MHFYENRESAAASSAPAKPAALDLPEAAPWTGNWSHLIVAWLFGAVVLAGLITFIMHFGTIEIFAAKLRGANPVWLTAAVGCQLATYVSAAAVWFRVLKRAGSPLPFPSLLRLAFVELFANQAVPTGGLSGSLVACAASYAAASPLRSPLQRSSSPHCRTTPPISWSARSLSSCFGIVAT